MQSKLSPKVAVPIVLLLLLLGALAGYFLHAVPASGLAVFHLRNGSEIVLNSGGDIGFSKSVASDMTLVDNNLWVFNGEMLVVSQLPAGIWFKVVNPYGFIAHVTADPNTPGAIMLVRYDASHLLFTMYCIEGICELGPSDQNLSKVPLGNKGVLDPNGNFTGPTSFDPNQINGIYGKYIEPGAPIPTFTAAPANTAVLGTPTPNQVATATAACQIFKSQFPGTPCP